MQLGKLWLRLLGVGEEEEADLDRRGFLRMLGGAAVVGAVAPTYVFAPADGWITSPGDILSPASVSIQASEYIVPVIYDNVFKPSLIFTKLRSSRFDFKKEYKLKTWGAPFGIRDC